MYGAAGWAYTPGVPGITPTPKRSQAGKGKGAGSGRFSGFKTRARQREYQDERDFKAGKV